MIPWINQNETFLYANLISICIISFWILLFLFYLAVAWMNSLGFPEMSKKNISNDCWQTSFAHKNVYLIIIKIRQFLKRFWGKERRSWKKGKEASLLHFFFGRRQQLVDLEPRVELKIRKAKAIYSNNSCSCFDSCFLREFICKIPLFFLLINFIFKIK